MKRQKSDISIHSGQGRFQNPVYHLRWGIMPLFLQKAPS